MQGKRLALVLVCIGMFGLIFSACNSSEEKAARAQLEQALALERQENLPEARRVLGDMVRQYPQTDAAEQGLAVQQRIIHEMDGIQRELRKTLESMVLVLAGYQSVTGKPLTSLSELDSGDYMFDSTYLVEAIPAGVKTYMLLRDDGSFRLWAYRETARMGMERDSAHRGERPFESDTVIEALRDDYATEERVANLTVVSPVASAKK